MSWKGIDPGISDGKSNDDARLDKQYLILSSLVSSARKGFTDEEWGLMPPSFNLACTIETVVPRADAKLRRVPRWHIGMASSPISRFFRPTLPVRISTFEATSPCWSLSWPRFQDLLTVLLLTLNFRRNSRQTTVLKFLLWLVINNCSKIFRRRSLLRSRTRRGFIRLLSRSLTVSERSILCSFCSFCVERIRSKDAPWLNEETKLC